MTKVRADRTVIVIGVFLFILGLAVAWNGYGYVQVERGWTMVISGTVVFSTGLLLVALGLVLRELRAIAGSAGRATLLLAKAKTLQLKDFDEDSYHVAPPRPVVPEERAVAAEFAPEENFELPAAKETDWKAGRASRLHLPRVDEIAEAGASRIPNPLAWMIRPYKPEPVSPPAPPPPPLQDEEFESWLEPERDGNFDQEPQQESPVETLQVADSPAELLAEPPEAEDLTGSLDAPEPAPQMEAQLAPAPAPEPQPEPELKPELEWEPASAPESEPAAQDAASEEDVVQPEIIGRYEAHGAHYVMYADGSIDADTAHGVYRFASMEELKQFIARQE